MRTRQLFAILTAACGSMSAYASEPLLPEADTKTGIVVRPIATLTAGYADGYSRRMSGGGYVVINGRRAPLAGRVCMDQTTVDVTGIDGVGPMTEATLIGEGITADDMAAITGTISYESLCAIGVRVKRIYK